MTANLFYIRFLAVSVGALALATLAPFFRDLNLMLELFVHFKVQYAVLAFFLSAAAAAAGRKLIATAALALAIFNASAFLPYMEINPAAADVPNSKLINLNLNHQNPQPDLTISFLRRERADIVVLEEVTLDWQKRLATLADIYPNMLFCGNPPDCNVALLSKTPWLSAEFRNLSEIGPYVAVARYGVDDANFTLVGTHLAPPTVPGLKKRIYSNQAQIEVLAAYLGALEGSVVVSGDLNTTQWSPSFAKIIEKTGLSRIHGGILPTWPFLLSFAGIPIDHVLAGPEFTTSTMTTGPYVGSDHRPLIATLRRNG